MNLWILETGGTIASRKLDQTIDLSLEQADYTAHAKDYFQITVQRPYYILSENLTPDRWILLAEEIRMAKSMGAEGILITHGSDTLPYSAAAISFLCSDLEIPIVFTAANRPPEEQSSNAGQNLTASFEFLEHSPQGVSVVWQNPDGNIYVHAGTALSEAVGDWFFSLGELRAQKKEGAWEFYPEQHKKTAPVPLPDRFDQRVSYLRALPGQEYNQMEWKEKPAALLHSLYHSGTVCAEGERTSFVGLKEACRAENLPLYICPAKSPQESAYASASVLQGEGVFPLFGISAEAAYALLLLAYNQKKEPPHDAVCRFLKEK